MEQIVHAFGVNWKLFTIQIVNFGLLLYLLHRFLYTPLFKVMDERQKKIAQGLEDAKTAEEAKKTIESTRETILKEARGEGDALVRDIRGKIQLESQESLREAESRSAKIIADAEALGARKKEEIILESKDELARVAVKAAEAILRARTK